VTIYGDRLLRNEDVLLPAVLEDADHIDLIHVVKDFSFERVWKFMRAPYSMAKGQLPRKY
jgi:hypothetical protein